MPQRNVMPTLPNQTSQKQRAPKKPQQGGGGVNIKALVILLVIVVGIITLIAIKGCSAEKPETDADSLPITTSEIVAVTTTPTPEEPEPADPSENEGTVLTDLLAEGSVFVDSNKYILATDIAYHDAQSLADSTVISMDKNLTLVPSTSCAYCYNFNSANITHTSGAVLTIVRRQAADFRNMPSFEEYTASLQGIAAANGIIKPVYGDVYVGTEHSGAYVEGTLKANNEETDKTILVMHVNGKPEIYSIAIVFDTQDELELLLNSVKLFGSSLRLD